MKSLLPAAAFNQDVLVAEDLPWVSDNGVQSRGHLEEELWHTPRTRNSIFAALDSAHATIEVGLYANWETGGVRWEDGTLVQNYLQIEDQGNPGQYRAFTCTATYTRDAVFSKTVDISNFAGDIAITATGSRKARWNDIDATPTDGGFHYDGKRQRYSYRSTFADDRSWQACAASALLYSV